MAVLVACYDPHRVRDRQAIEAWKDKYEVKAPVFAAGVFVLRTNDPPQQVFDALQACLKAHANLFVGVRGTTCSEGSGLGGADPELCRRAVRNGPARWGVF